MKNAAIISVLIILSVVFHKNTINEFPSHIHAWSQADRYALSLGFLNNGFDFFHPQTYNLNVQFPAIKALSVEEGITAVDFPIHEFIVAVLMKLLHTTEPWVFRTYSLIYTLIGLLFLFRLCNLLIERNSWLSYLIVILVFTAPVYTYYMVGFIPSVTSLANLFICLFFYFRYVLQNRSADFYRAVFFITLSTLCRTSFGVYLVALFIHQIALMWIGKRRSAQNLTVIAFAITVVAAYYSYNNYLRNTYGSVFLSSFFPAKNFEELKAVFEIIRERWLLQYFTVGQYLCVAAVLAAAVVSFIKTKQLDYIQQQLILFIAISFSGTVLFFLLMAIQFKEHDYYFLDSFFPVAIMLLIAGASAIKNNMPAFTGPVFTVAVAFLFSFQCYAVQQKRNDSGSWDRYQATINNFKGAEQFLSEQHVDPEARILVIDAYSPNIPFILMNRKGYAVITTSKEEILKALRFRFDYVVMQDQFLLSDVLNNYPGLIDYLEPIANNGRITLYRYHALEKQKSLFGFLGLDRKQPIIDAIADFDNYTDSAYWNNITLIADRTTCNGSNINSANLCAYADSTVEYGVGFSIPVNRLKGLTKYTVWFEGDFCSASDLKDILISGYAGHAENVHYQQYYEINTQVKPDAEWTKVQFMFNIEKIAAEDEIKIFIWNPRRKFVCYDNLRVRIY